jgi:hypothetical protein
MKDKDGTLRGACQQAECKCLEYSFDGTSNKCEGCQHLGTHHKTAFDWKSMTVKTTQHESEAAEADTKRGLSSAPSSPVVVATSNGNGKGPFVVDVSGKWALVSGAGRGIGKAIALALAQRGVNIILVARTRANLEETAQLCTEKNVNCSCIVMTCDLSDPLATNQLINDAVARIGGVDILVNTIEPLSFIIF